MSAGGLSRGAAAASAGFRASVDTPIGRMMMRSDGRALTGLCLEDWWWAKDAHDVLGDAAHDDAIVRDDVLAEGAAAVFAQTRRWLGEYFGCDESNGPRAGRESRAGHQPDWTPPLDAGASGAATPFRREVWALVREIPWGETVSYGELAAELSAMRGGRPMAAQAVGGAVKHNPITLIVPCHRVVGAGRAFGGYGGRLDVKAALLEHEGVDLSRFDGVPGLD